MKNIAPDVFRQRLLVEGFYNIDVDKKAIENYYKGIVKELDTKMYGSPIIFSPGGEGKKENQGYDAFAPLIDSGISVYIWSSSRFFSIIIYTCKAFGEKTAVDFTKEYFRASKIVYEGF